MHTHTVVPHTYILPDGTSGSLPEHLSHYQRGHSFATCTSSHPTHSCTTRSWHEDSARPRRVCVPSKLMSVPWAETEDCRSHFDCGYDARGRHEWRPCNQGQCEQIVHAPGNAGAPPPQDGSHGAVLQGCLFLLHVCLGAN